MTPARKRALQWFHDRGEVDAVSDEGPTVPMMIRMICDDHLQYRKDGDRLFHTLTEKGRRALHGDRT